MVPMALREAEKGGYRVLLKSEMASEARTQWRTSLLWLNWAKLE